MPCAPKDAMRTTADARESEQPRHYGVNIFITGKLSSTDVIPKSQVAF